MTIPGPEGPLEGEMILVPEARAGVVIVPGSGPVDRDGNGPMGLRSDSYKLLADGLSRAGVSTLRIDKRGFFGSAGAVADPEDVTIAAYAEDAGRWLSAFADKAGLPCVWLAGHSEGGLVALVAAAQGNEPCGLILLATPGRPLGVLMREQFRANPANAPYLEELDGLVAALERGETRDPDTVSAPLRPLFRPGLQRYMTQLFDYDPAAIASGIEMPVLILQGETDIQVRPQDARRLSEAMPQARLVLLPGVTHMLKTGVPGEPLATYTDPGLPLDPAVARTIADFVGATQGP
ncbi:alpha/beta hydrolase [Kaustia mangrovi]|uniref:alpha/beta hydrolase n=1 Tax=Kaustia mangrovi TaxID=2593653 RepID=UPI001BCAB76D|nr:alpha/beta fold hydrolase [Kaustia mangrovi]